MLHGMSSRCTLVSGGYLLCYGSCGSSIGVRSTISRVGGLLFAFFFSKVGIPRNMYLYGISSTYQYRLRFEQDYHGFFRLIETRKPAQPTIQRKEQKEKAKS